MSTRGAGRRWSGRRDIEMRLTPEQLARMRQRILDGVSYREVGRAFGICASAVARFAIRHELTVEHRAKMAIDPRTRAEKAPKGRAARLPRLTEAQVAEKPQAPPPAPPERTVVAARAGRLTRAEEERLVAEAIAAGIGRRYERVSEVAARQINGADDAVRWLEAHGVKVQVRAHRRGSLTYYRATRDGIKLLVRPWYPAAELVRLARQMAATEDARVIPIRDAIAERIAKADNPPVNQGLIQYYGAPSRVAAGATNL